MPVRGVDPNERLTLPLDYEGETITFTYRRLSYPEWLGYQSRLKFQVNTDRREASTDSTEALKHLFLACVEKVENFTIEGHDKLDWGLEQMDLVWQRLPITIGRAITDRLSEESRVTRAQQKN